MRMRTRHEIRGKLAGEYKQSLACAYSSTGEPIWLWYVLTIRDDDSYSCSFRVDRNRSGDATIYAGDQLSSAIRAYEDAQ
jgi:hypothetical protein